MKIKHIIAIIALVLCLAVIVVSCVAVARYSKASYELEATIVSYDGNTAVAETADGNLWGYNTSHVIIGEQVILVMNDHHTPNDIFDDEVLRVNIK